MELHVSALPIVCRLPSVKKHAPFRSSEITALTLWLNYGEMRMGLRYTLTAFTSVEKGSGREGVMTLLLELCLEARFC